MLKITNNIANLHDSFTEYPDYMREFVDISVNVHMKIRIIIESHNSVVCKI